MSLFSKSSSAHPPHITTFEKGAAVQAIFHTSKGNFTAKLFAEQCPITVGNFVGLATGETPWKAPDGETVQKPLYNGTIFHRVIKGFMLQGGDPEGTGRGGPGYRFADEFVSELRHNKPGILSMANAGPNTNGSQFFVTEVPTPHLDDRHTVFGEVVEGMDIVLDIASTPTGMNDKPREDVVIEKIEIKINE